MLVSINDYPDFAREYCMLSCIARANQLVSTLGSGLWLAGQGTVIGDWGSLSLMGRKSKLGFKLVATSPDFGTGASGEYR